MDLGREGKGLEGFQPRLRLHRYHKYHQFGHHLNLLVMDCIMLGNCPFGQSIHLHQYPNLHNHLLQYRLLG